MCGRAGAHTGARDRRTDGARPVGCSTSEQSASRASAPTHTLHTRRTGPTHARHTAPNASASAWTPAVGAPGAGCAAHTAPAPRWTRTHGRGNTRRTGVGAQIKDQRNARRGTTHTRETRPPHAPPYDMRGRAGTHARAERVRARHAAHAGTPQAARRTQARRTAISWRVGCSEIEQSAHAHEPGRDRRPARPPLRYARASARNGPRARALTICAWARVAPPLTICAGVRVPPGPLGAPSPARRHRVSGQPKPVSGVGCSESEHRPTRRDRRAPGVDTDANPLGVSP